jgi:hypothetical protein
MLALNELPPRLIEDVIWMAQRMDVPAGTVVAGGHVNYLDTRYTRMLKAMAISMMDAIEKELGAPDA